MSSHEENRPESIQESLLARLRVGEEGVVPDIYRHYYNRLMRYGCSVEPDRDLVHDVIQELFVWLLENVDQLRSVRNLDTYLFFCMKRNVTSAARRERHNKQRAEQFLAAAEQEERSAETRLIGEESRQGRTEWLMRQIAQLPDHQREVLFLRFFENFSYDEIAEIFMVSSQVVRNTVFRAMKNLRRNTSRLESICIIGMLAWFALLG